MHKTRRIIFGVLSLIAIAAALFINRYFAPIPILNNSTDAEVVIVRTVADDKLVDFDLKESTKQEIIKYLARSNCIRTFQKHQNVSFNDYSYYLFLRDGTEILELYLADDGFVRIPGHRYIYDLEQNYQVLNAISYLVKADSYTSAGQS